MPTEWPEAYTAMWLPEHRYAPNEDRQVIRALRRAPGIVGPADFQVLATDPASMQIRVLPGRAIIDGTIDELQQGSYTVTGPDQALLDVPPSDSDLPTTHLVVAWVRDEDFGGPSYDWTRALIVGTPGQGAPPQPENSIPLAQVTVGAGWSSVGQGAITDLRDLVNPILTLRSSTHVLAPQAADIPMPRTEQILLQAPNATGITSAVGAMTIVFPAPFPRAVASLVVNNVTAAAHGIMLCPFDVRLNLFQVAAFRLQGAPGGPAGALPNTAITCSYMAIGW